MAQGKVYIAGPMRGIDKWNFPAFDAWRDHMLAEGWEVISPADMDRAKGMDENDYPDLPAWFTLEEALRRDFAAIVTCTAILLLPGWEASTGVHAELHVARNIGLEVLRAWDDNMGHPFCMTVINNGKVDRILAAGPEKQVKTVAEAPITADTVIPEWDDHEGWRNLGTETRVVDPTTGGEKGSKLARFDLVPADVMYELAEHYGRGCQKYDDRNWERGYKWGLSIAALERHLALFKQGIDMDDDPEVGVFPHLVAVIWHACALRAFQKRGLGTDDRSL